MSATSATERVGERLGSCPGCNSDVIANAYAVRWRGDWYHVGCAIECDEEERAASERSDQHHQPSSTMSSSASQKIGVDDASRSYDFSRLTAQGR